jgi:NADH-quinone oxidoreductase subunit E
MLTDDEKKEIEAEFPRYEQKSAVCVEALKTVQRHRGWVSDETLIDIAEFLEMAPAELDAVATFYNLIFRKSVGRHIILVCNSVSCWIMGYERIVRYLQERLGIGFGETTADEVFTLLPIVCLGACDQAPAMMIDDELYGNLDEEKIEEILANFTKPGT